MKCGVLLVVVITKKIEEIVCPRSVGFYCVVCNEVRV